MRRLTAAAALVACGCASMARPPGGPERHTPARVIAMSPDSGATNVHQRTIDIQFDEVVQDLEAGTTNGFTSLVIVSPEVGSIDVGWHRDRISVKGHEPFLPHTTYRVTLLPGIHDLHGNVTKTAASVVFSTDSVMPTGAISGDVFDWVGTSLARNGVVTATRDAGQKDSTVYIAIADTTGHFSINPLPPGRYRITGFLDQNENRARDRTEKWDQFDTTLVDSVTSLEVLAAQRDTTPATITSVTPFPKDSLSFAVDFDQPLDPYIELQPLLFRVQRADSTEMTVASVVWADQDAADRAARAAAADTTNRGGRGAPPPAARPGATDTIFASIVPIPTTVDQAQSLAQARLKQQQSPRRKPKRAPPQRTIVIHLAVTNPLVAGGKYRVTATGMRNLLGRSAPTSHTIAIPAAPKTPGG